MTEHLVRSRPGESTLIEITPASAGWSYLEFSIHHVVPGAPHQTDSADREIAIVPLEGSGVVRVDGRDIDLGRRSVWDEMPRVVYIPPDRALQISTETDLRYAIGGARADGRFPVRVIEPHEMHSEVRGGGASRRQVNHILAHPLPAERLILYEVYVPRGTWSGWPPHCHDGYAGSPYLEETYYFRLDPPNGFAVHRNWREDTEFDETLVAGDGDVVLVTQGFHSSVACPGSNMYFLNYLAGEPVGDERATPPHFHPDHTWIETDWSAGLMGLPTVGPLPAP
ncbi:MAG: 5-deoxy-glucuronate isomerase [Acidimicrobiia bacterium]|nr:5-deoxy-glucuronate isomerase [Acidimicrobiia bacterium]